MKKLFLSFLALGCSMAGTHAADNYKLEYYNEDHILATNLDYGRYMLSWQRGVTDKAQYMLLGLERGELSTQKIYLSGHASFSHYREYTDTDGKFPILGRFPSQHTKGKSGEETVIDTIDLGVTVIPTEWVSVFVHGIYTDVEFPRQENSQIREAFINFGNLEESPFYASIGKKVVYFGKFESFNPTTHSVSNHFYRVDTDDATLEVGMITDRFRIAATGMYGGRQLRVATNPEDDGFLANWAIAGQYTASMGDWVFDFGAGYLYSSIYDSDNANHPGVNSNPQSQRKRNGAIDFWAQARYGSFTAQAEYTRTERDWPATGAPVEAFTLQAAYETSIFERKTHLSAVYGLGKQGNKGDQFHKLDQVILGAETFITPNFSLAAEYVHNSRFVPLIRIGLVSDQDVNTNTFIISGKFWF